MSRPLTDNQKAVIKEISFIYDDHQPEKPFDVARSLGIDYQTFRRILNQIKEGLLD